MVSEDRKVQTLDKVVRTLYGEVGSQEHQPKDAVPT